MILMGKGEESMRDGFLIDCGVLLTLLRVSGKGGAAQFGGEDWKIVF